MVSDRTIKIGGFKRLRRVKTFSREKTALLAGKPAPQTGTRHRFAFYCDEWLRLRKSKIRESTYIKYDTVLEKHIKPKLGGCFPMGITTGVVDDFTRELLFEDELAVKTAHDILVVLHGVLKHTAAQLPGIFPAVEINYPKESRRETRVLSRDEQTQLVRYSLTDTDACKLGVLLILLSGVRIGELCALKWGNIDLVLSKLHQEQRPELCLDRYGFRILCGAPNPEQVAWGIFRFR